jgi:hypothetical protein
MIRKSYKKISSQARDNKIEYDYEYGKDKCYSHGIKGFFRDRRETSCNNLKNAGCVWKSEEEDGWCDLPEGNSNMMRNYLNKDSSGRLATKSVAALKKHRSKKRNKKRTKKRPKRKKSKRRTSKRRKTSERR